MIESFYKIYRFIFSRRRFYNLNKLLYYSSLRGLGILNFENSRVSGELHFLQSYLSKKKILTVLDVGANIGIYSEKIISIAPNTKIYSFEPHPDTFIKLKESSEKYGFQSFPFGCGKENSQVLLYDYMNNDGSPHASLYPDVIREIHGSATKQHLVNIIKLDDFVLQNNVDEIDLLKIDTEGNELNVLLGLENFIKKRKVKLIHFEFNEMNVVSRVFFKDIHTLLKNNYKFYRMLQDGLVPMAEYSTVFWEIFAYQNIVAVLIEQ